MSKKLIHSYLSGFEVRRTFRNWTQDIKINSQAVERKTQEVKRGGIR